MNIKANIEDTRKGFEESFASGDFYNRQTQDAEHLERILSFINVRGGMRILDLGCGRGYLTFPIAEGNPDCEVTGLDIVSDAIDANRSRAREVELDNLTFVNYDGIDFPFEAGTFDLVVTRYSLHHFPDIEHSIGEVSRVLKGGGSLFISDPCPNDCDKDRFVDDYMRLKKDGHIKFYTKSEWVDICDRFGLQIVDDFESTIRFPKKKDTAFGYEDVLKKHDKAVIESYDLVETDTELFVTERVNNILFRKIKNVDLIRKLSAEERATALDLAWRVFSEYESPDYSKEGTLEFKKCLHDEEYLAGIEYYGAFDGQRLIGLVGIRSERKHICFFFVDGKYHRQGIGTRLFKAVCQEYPDHIITLNSSPYGVPFYHALGFKDTDKEQTVNGIRFTPMKYEGFAEDGD